MRVFSHPLRIDPDGSFTTVEQGSARQAQQVAIAIVSTSLTERPLAPDFGIFDPVAVGITRAEVAAALEKLRDTMQVALTEDEINAATVRKNIIGELDAINATLGLKEKEGAKPLSE